MTKFSPIARLLLLALPLLFAGCAATPSDPTLLKPEVVQSLKQYTKAYVLQPGDQLEVSIFHVPELSHTVIVRPDGYVSLPVVKEVKASGMVVSDFTAELTKLYGARLVNPDVSVNVANPRAAQIYVVGEVARPGPIAVRDAPNVALAIAASGGTARSAAMDNVAVIRLEDDGYLRGYVIERRDSGETAFYMAMTGMMLQAGDIVVVPESGRSQFVRFISDYLNTPLSGANQVLSPYFQFRLIGRL